MSVTPYLGLAVNSPLATDGSPVGQWQYDHNFALIDTAIQELAQGGGGGGAVSSVFGRTGSVGAEEADYAAFYDALGAAAAAQSNAEASAASLYLPLALTENTTVDVGIEDLYFSATSGQVLIEAVGYFFGAALGVDGFGVSIQPLDAATGFYNVPSPPLFLNAFFQDNLGRSDYDTWEILNDIGAGHNPNSILQFSHSSGSSGQATVEMPNLVLNSATPTVTSGQVGLGSTTADTATAGSASLPDAPVGFLEVNIGGTVYKIPYYAA